MSAAIYTKHTSQTDKINLVSKPTRQRPPSSKPYDRKGKRMSGIFLPEGLADDLVGRQG